jgi:plasmid stabilization system protein ParE
MTAEPGFALHPLAAQDIIEIWEYIAAIAYAPEESPLWVVAVMHGRRSPRIMAAILRDRE